MAPCMISHWHLITWYCPKLGRCHRPMHAKNVPASRQEASSCVPDDLQQSSSGKQLNSRKKTSPRCAFGTAERFGKGYYSTACSPGPGAYAS